MLCIENEYISKAFNIITSNPNFNTIYEIVSQKSKNPMLVGGKVYRHLIELIHGRPAKSECCDYDFLVSDIDNSPCVLPDGWYYDGVKYPGVFPEGGLKPLGLLPSMNTVISGNIFYTTAPCTQIARSNIGTSTSTHIIGPNKIKIDIINLSSFPRIHQAPPTLEGYCDIVPLNIQTLALDLWKAKLYTTSAYSAIEKELVLVNNTNQLLSYAKFKHIEAKSYVLEKARSIKFDSLIPKEINIEKGGKKKYYGQLGPLTIDNESLYPQTF